MRENRDNAIYHEVPGGTDLVQWFGRVPSFHDAEILSLDLRRKGLSVLRLHGWINTGKVDDDKFYVLDRHAIVTLLIKDIMDLQMEGFSAQNVIGGLILRRASDRPERRRYLTLDPLPEDFEIELEQCYGLGGLIRARSISFMIKPGKPDDRDA